MRDKNAKKMLFGILGVIFIRHLVYLEDKLLGLDRTIAIVILIKNLLGFLDSHDSNSW